jgi:RNA polymerase sigma-70 factor (ECF subfamily)
MTTAPDLPLPVTQATVPAQAADPDRAALALVPSAPLGEEIVDFDEALRASQPRLLRYATRRIGDQHEAEELVQEAMLRAFQHRHELATEDDLMAWLTVVTGRLVIDRLRVRGRTTPVAEVPPGSRTGRDIADVVVARDEARIALDALEAMPSRQAAVLWAREVEGLSYDEIGRRYGLSEPTVRSLLHRARRTLRREYADRGGTLPSLGLIALAPWARGLHWASRLRDIARKGGVATATAATGIAIATVAPLWSSPAPAAPHVVSLPPYVAKAHTTPLVTTVSHPAARVTTATAPTAASPTVRHTPLLVKPACTTAGHGVNCHAPQAPTLFLALPNHKDVGIEQSWLPIDCTKLPTIPLTHCQPSDGKTN